MKTNATFILYTTAAAIVSMSFSVSLTHIFIFLAFSGFLVMQIFSAYRNYSSFPLKLIKTKDLFLSERNSSLFSKFLQKLLHNNFIKTPFFPGLLLFSVLLISGLINHEQSDSFSWIYKSEFSDIALFMFGILIYSLARKNQKNRKVLTTAFEIFIVV
ncbi:MAG: hypothetical protein OEZ34_03930 [Spirochaetia bacterium]|nr:hypothetical protein [Spirochaetia bacterium]